MASLCPICFEDQGSRVEYATMSNHSWNNVTRCDAHGICWSCLNRYVEVQILEEGRFNLKCPGIGCHYRLLPLDVERALEPSQEQRREEGLQLYASMRSASHADRLKEVLLGNTRGPSEDWLLQECQVCPQCLSLVRRETGCLHVFCRCGCDFCVGCGGPGDCLCPELEKDGEVVFAAWLRVSPESPIEWLRDAPGSEPDVPERLLTTLGFWLWMAYIPVDLPWATAPESEDLATGPALPLQPLKWRRPDASWEEIGEINLEEAFYELAAEPQILHFPLDRFSDLADLDGLEEEEFFDYGRVPRRPWRLFATQKTSRREDRHHYLPMRWKNLSWTGDDAAAPLQRRRQKRAVAAEARAAERTAGAARKVEERSRQRQKMRRCLREQARWIE